jgi:hypothetical protein
VIARRIIPRDQITGSMVHERALDRRQQCHHTLELDGTVYRCGRAHVDGIHDAFREHGDGGAVRW